MDQTAAGFMNLIQQKKLLFFSHIPRDDAVQACDEWRERNRTSRLHARAGLTNTAALPNAGA
jgi:hypothetical protein